MCHHETRAQWTWKNFWEINYILEKVHDVFNVGTASGTIVLGTWSGLSTHISISRAYVLLRCMWAHSLRKLKRTRINFQVYYPSPCISRGAIPRDRALGGFGGPRGSPDWQGRIHGLGRWSRSTLCNEIHFVFACLTSSDHLVVACWHFCHNTMESSLLFYLLWFEYFHYFKWLDGIYLK